VGFDLSFPDMFRALSFVAVSAVLVCGWSLWPVETTTATAAATAPTPSPPTQILPLGEVRPGMKGYGLTVFAGTKPERFEVSVVGVLRRFLPNQDIILIRSDDARLLHSGIVAGMSGSPIYLEGKLAGALAYGWSFSKDPLAGVTPIESMRRELTRPLRGPQATPSSEAALDHDRGPTIADVADARQKALPLFGRLPLPPRLLEGAEPHLQRVSVPLSLAGFSAGSAAEIGRALEPYHLVAASAGGVGRPDSGPTRFEDGGPIAVQLIRGDMSMAGTGTVSQVVGDKVLAFGHPMFNVGEIYLPIATAEIHTFMSALSTSMKLSSPMREIGSLIQDRQPAILGDLTRRADMIPIEVTVAGPSRPEQTFRAEVARHRFLTSVLAGNVVSSSVQSMSSDLSDATMTLRSTIRLKGFAPIVLTDSVFAPDGISARVLASSSGLRALSELAFNPFTPVRIEGVSIRVDVDYRPDFAEVIGVAVAGEELEPGSRPSVYVTLRPFNGREYTETVAIEVPRSLAGQTVKIVAGAGTLSRPELAMPENLAGLVENLKKGWTARELVIGIETADEGVTVRGAVLADLPGSVIDTLRPASSSRRADVYRRVLRVVTPSKPVLIGSKDLTIHVREETR